MSRLTDLIGQLKKTNSQLAGEIEREVKVLSSRREFGLNFERHKPEVVDLPLRKVRKGDKVRILPERGSSKKEIDDLWIVKKIIKDKNKKKAILKPFSNKSETERETLIDDLLVVAEFRDSIYPGLVSTGKIEKGEDKPYHTVINGENYHALKALSFTHKGKIDVIYIDPPYNTGAKDWKYNNDYVDSEDMYRHSKWLAFMERRLKLAKELLNPNESVMLVTIDEKEVHRLALLISQIFVSERTQMITTVTNQRGVSRGQEFARVDEYMLAVFVGEAQVSQGSDDFLTSKETESKQRIDVWNRLMRRGTDSLRKDSPRQFYPIFVNPENKEIVEIGDALPLDTPRTTVKDKPGLDTVWPIRTNGAEGRWTVSPGTLREYVKKGYAKVGARSRSGDSWSISYLIKKDIQRVESGEIKNLGKDDRGVLILKLDQNVERTKLPRTVWKRDSHNAGTYGSALLRKFIPGRKFPFPKSLYLVEDSLRVFLRNKKSATVLDFFSGSGTTAHALMRLNKQDGGKRQSILVTNNEVSADEQKSFKKNGLRAGDPEWEELGICEYITKPRIKAAITGKTPEGEPVKGDYKFTDEFKLSEGFKENAEFFNLTYESPISISHNLAFKRIAPLLWMCAGSEGARIDNIPKTGWSVVDNYGVLVDLDKSSAFCKEVKNKKNIKCVFIVTNDERRFQSVAKKIPAGVEPIRLYESYLKNFQFVSGD